MDSENTRSCLSILGTLFVGGVVALKCFSCIAKEQRRAEAERLANPKQPNDNSTPADKAVTRGFQAATKKDFDKAFKEFSEAIRLDPRRRADDLAVEKTAAVARLIGELDESAERRVRGHHSIADRPPPK